MKILIVEDNFEVRQMIRRFVKNIADEIVELDNGEDALETYIAHKPDWVLMDFQMGEVNGIQATKQIISKYPQAKIVIITSHKEVALRDKAKEAGVSGFILKENLSVLKDLLT